MRDIIDVSGLSGATYRFTRFRTGHPLSAMGGNFVYARATDGAPTILYAGETQNLLTGAGRWWDRAVNEHGAEDLFTRLNISEGVRRREHEDILANGPPPMNADMAAEAP